MMRRALLLLVGVWLATAAAAPAAAPPAVAEAAGDISVAADVDVLVVGGSTGAVAAAIEAAGAGATVFLAAPRPYLGEDVCATKRLWLEAGADTKDPLVATLFQDERVAEGTGLDPRALPFTYTADPKAGGRHPDTRQGRLRDGRLGPPHTDSVEYGGDPTITCDLGKAVEVAEARALVFTRPGDFGLGEMTVETSVDGKAWQKAGTADDDSPRGGTGLADVQALDPAVPVGRTVRFVRLHLTREPGTERILLGEVILLGAGEPPEKKAPEAGPIGPVRPMHVKRVLDDALLAAGVRFLYGCYPDGVLTDARGQPAGIVMVNWSGRQAVRAKVILDATPRATVARMAGADFAPWPAGPQTFERVVIGGPVRSGKGVTGRKTGLALPSQRGPKPILAYTLTIDMPDASWSAFQAAEQAGRDRTFHPDQVDASEVLFQVPPDPMTARAAVEGEAPDWGKVDLSALRPAKVDRLLVLGGCAGVSRRAAADLLRPPAQVAVGRRLGRAAAREAAGVGALHGVRLAGRPPGKPAARGEVREAFHAFRFPPEKGKTVPADARSLPVLGTWDVVVIGGGTGGAPAGIGAARGDARTLVVEYLHGLGGVGTLGMITKYYHGYRGGFTAEVDKGVEAVGAPTWAVGKPEYWRRANRKAGADLWFWSFGCGALVRGRTVTGAVVATPLGRGVVLADVVIDSTGNADIAAAAGAETRYTGGEHMGVQGAGLPPIELGAGYTNTDYMFADDTDVVDLWHLFVYAREKFADAYDLGQLVDTRERRRIVGDVTITPMDMMLGRTWPDTVSMHKSNFDSHGFTVHPMFLIRPPDREGMTVFVPLRALMPKGLENLMVTGLGVSAHRDAIPVIRMQPCVQNQGYAAGRVAAAAARSTSTVRQVDLNAVQEHLVRTECLPPDVLDHEDSFPLPRERVAKAVANVADGYKDLAVLLAQPRQALPLLL
ncbi:MAG: FAD-dependent oxidoreductase, partial [Planctomycetota bacterium]|nr:FAD-dependent oxidoreductase [Planctomycetota bacterium]